MDAWIENRGGEDVAFGYVYAGDTRLGYCTDQQHVHVFQANWGTPLQSEGQAMLDALRTAFPTRALIFTEFNDCPVATAEREASIARRGA